MSNPLRSNVLANLFGKGWAALVSLLVVPWYIRLVGIEAYGLIGLSVALTGLLAVFDLGLSTAASRELARSLGARREPDTVWSVFATIELIYWAIGLLMGVALFLAATPIANYWLRNMQLDEPQVLSALRMFALALTLQWPIALYTGAIGGLQRQVALNVVLGMATTVRNVGAAVALASIAPSLEVFFLWQAAASFVQVLAMRSLLAWYLPGPDSPVRPTLSALRQIRSFAAGVTGTSILAVALTQADKIVLSRTLPLHQFGYYTLAWTVASALPILVTPIYSAFFPRYAELVAAGQQDLLAAQYHRGVALAAVLVIPPALVVAAFSPQVLQVWTNDAGVAAGASLPLCLLAVGSALNALMYMPSALQLAYGWTSLAFASNLVAVIAIVPLTILWSLRWGAPGGAAAWVLLNLGYVSIVLRIMHRRLLVGQERRLYLADIGGPILASAVVVLVARYALWGARLARGEWVAVIAAVGAFAAAGSVLSAPQTRRLMMEWLPRPRSGAEK